MNAATSIITTKSPYMVRTSFTVPQVNEALGTWAYKSGVRKVYTMVSDFGPGHDGEAAFQQRLQGGRRRDHRLGALSGGEPGLLRVPAARQGHRTRTRSTSGCPAAPQPAAIGKALAERGIDPKKTKVLGQGELTVRRGAEEHGRRRRSASSPPSTTTTITSRRRTRSSSPTTTPTSSATPTCSRSAATTACT